MRQWNDIKILGDPSGMVSKYIFTKDDAVAESVLYRYPTYQKRTVICCSTMSGCPVGCRFCGAGDAFVRSLTPDEIVSQPRQLLEDACTSEKIEVQQIERLQIMFMSMGEPLLNRKGMEGALVDLYARFSNAALLISSIGPRIDYDWVYEISKQIPTIGLQFSIHESTDEARNALIPFKAKLSLEEIADVGERWFAATGRTPFFNYCCHDKNTSIEDAYRLHKLFDPNIWQATLSVICERDEQVAAANARQRELTARFESEMQDRGFRTRMFDPAGQDTIGGGCGQLWYVQDWMRKNPDKAKKSCGFSLPVIHTPR